MGKQKSQEAVKRHLLKRCHTVEARHIRLEDGRESVTVIAWHHCRPYVGTGRTEAEAFREARRAFDADL